MQSPYKNIINEYFRLVKQATDLNIPNPEQVAIQQRANNQDYTKTVMVARKEI